MAFPLFFIFLVKLFQEAYHQTTYDYFRIMLLLEFILVSFLEWV